MDYNQSTQDKEVNLFTTGAGTNEENVNTVESENNLDLSNQSVEWGNPQTREDYQHLGNTSIVSVEQAEKNDNSPQVNTETTPKNVLRQADSNALGQIVPTMPPGYTEEASVDSTLPLQEKESSRKENLDSPTIAQKIIEEQEAKLSQDGNIFAFSESIAKMRSEANSGGKENA